MAVSMLAVSPTASMARSAPSPPVSALTAWEACTSRPSIGTAPNRAAISSRAGTMSTARIRAAPISRADMIAISPTGPQPITATESPGWIPARSAPKKPVARMSPTKSACSSPTPSGTGSSV